MKSFKIIEQLQDLIINSSKIPLSNKVVINQEQVLNLFDELLRVIPDEMKEAQKIIEDRQNILIDAQQEGEIIVKEAKDTIDKMINQDEITKLAREKSDQILAFAKQTARDLRAGANAYADEVLEDAQKHLERLLETLKKSREELNQAR
jgi:F0F1-type ATP synthase membrane subunit b/b'